MDGMNVRMMRIAQAAALWAAVMTGMLLGVETVWAAEWDLDPARVALPGAATLAPFTPPAGSEQAVMGLSAYAGGDLPGAAVRLEAATGGQGPLAATAAFFLGAARFKAGEYSGAAAALAAPSGGPGSPGPADDGGFFLRPDALLLLGMSLEAAGDFTGALGRYEAWLALGERNLKPLALLRAGACAARLGDWGKAGIFLKELCLTFPWSQSVDAGDALAAQLFAKKRINWSPDSRESLLQKARILVDRRKVSQAQALLARLKKGAGEKDAPLLLYLEGKLLYALRKTSASIDLLAKVSRDYPKSSIRPWAMYHEAKGLWRSSDPADAARMESLLASVLREYPNAADAREVCARHLMLLQVERGRFREALDTAQTIIGMGRGGEIGENAERLSGLLRFVLGDYSGAANDFAAYLRDNAGSDWDGGARYWLGRTFEKLGDPGNAASQYKVGAENRPNEYYGMKSLERLRALAAGGSAAVAAAKPAAPVYAGAVCPAGPGAKDAALPPEGQAMAGTAEALLRGGLTALAYEALDFAAGRYPKNGALAVRSMALADSLGRHMQALRTAWRSFASCMFRGDARELEPVREYIYPRKYAELVRKNLEGSGVDPDVVFGLIRQESFFNKDAVSGAGAIGLMQVMPATAKTLAAKTGLTYKREMLFDPAYNIRLGTRYFLNKYEAFGSVPYTLCSYNAGAAKLKVWIEHLGGLGDELFTEFIPYTETRDYVKRILANRVMYKLLY